MRLEGILKRIPEAREQLLAALEDLGPTFDLATIQAAMQSGDPRQRNRVAVIERELDVLIAYMEELASRGLAEAQRSGLIEKASGQPFERLADLRVITRAAAQRLQDIKDMRNALAHAYPPASWRSLHDAVQALCGELDSYTAKVGGWLESEGVLRR
jgi:uncharacterized protein YutE (UPF0331/DUF86 family)